MCPCLPVSWSALAFRPGELVYVTRLKSAFPMAILWWPNKPTAALHHSYLVGTGDRDSQSYAIVKVFSWTAVRGKFDQQQAVEKPLPTPAPDKITSIQTSTMAKQR